MVVRSENDAVLGAGLDHPGCVCFGESKRLFAENMFAGARRGQNLREMFFVGAADVHRVDCRIGEHGIEIGGMPGDVVLRGEFSVRALHCR